IMLHLHTYSVLYYYLPNYLFLCFLLNAPATTTIYTLSLHDALPISTMIRICPPAEDILLSTVPANWATRFRSMLCTSPLNADSRSEEHTSELQSRFDLVCRLLLEKKKNKTTNNITTNKRSR